MIQLFLTKPTLGCENDDNSASLKISLLDKLESVIWSLILSSGGRSEARLWLYKALSGIDSLSPRQQQELFCTLLRSKRVKRSLAAQLMRLIFDKRPHRAGSVLAKKSYLLEDFFKGNSRRVTEWFANLSSGGTELNTGAKALTRFAFVNRDTCWEELEWKGRHGQSPAMVATKPHYFLDLDIQRTVDNFVEYVPEFWSSNIFSETLASGEIFPVDTEYFVDLFVDWMYKDDWKEVWDLLKDFLMQSSFASLCNHLLIVLEERDLSAFLQLIKKYLNPGVCPRNFFKSSVWLEIVLQKCSDVSIDHLLLLNAVINQGRQILMLLRDEEEQKAEIKSIAMQINEISSNGNSLVPLFKEWSNSKTIRVMKWLGLQSWVLHYLLSETCQTPESWEALFFSNEISFRNSDNFALLSPGGILEENSSDFNDRESRHKKKGRSRKKQRRSLDYNVGYGDELLDAEISTDKLQGRSWFLSTDDYSTSWNSVDLPEHLSKNSFSTWMNWLCSMH